MAVMRHKEAIHSGHFMVSEFEAEDLPPPLSESSKKEVEAPHNIVDIGLKQLFQRMSIAYRHKLTSPKWNHFKGLKLRWKDKIRLNNVIWRCWHMQFIKGKNKLLCAFANPLEIDHDHNMMESGALLEGKYWKRKARTITSEYQRWRLYHRNQTQFDNETRGHGEDCSNNAEGSHPYDDIDIDHSLIDSDLFVGDLFDNLENTNHSFAVPFPNPRDVYKSTTNADFIQPALLQLQPNLEEINIGDLEWLNPTTPPPPVVVVSSTSSPGVPCNSSSKALLKKEVSSGAASYDAPAVPKPYPNHEPYYYTHPHYHAPASDPSITIHENYSSSHHPQAPPPSNGPHPPQRDLLRKSHRARFFYHQHTSSSARESSSDCSCRSVPYPPSHHIPPRTRSWSTSQINGYPSSYRSQSEDSEIVALLKSSSSSSNNHVSSSIHNTNNNNSGLHRPPSLQLSIPPPPPNSAPQPTSEAFREMKSTPDSSSQASFDPRRSTSREGARNGFDTLRSLLPALRDNSNLKISKAALLHKGGEYLQRLKSERGDLQSEITGLRSKINSLNADIAAFQACLPSVELTGPEYARTLEPAFHSHVRDCTQRNWKYWMFSLLMQPLLESFETSVGAGSFEDLCRTSLSWLDQHCSMRFLRDSCLKSLTYLSTATDVLSHPEKLPETSILEAVNGYQSIANNNNNNLMNSHNNNNKNGIIKREF